MHQPIEWDERFSVGIDEIDRQHQQLFDLVNGLQMIIANDEKKTVISAALADMARYIDSHFSTEERYLEHHPRIDIHRLKHLDFIDKTLDFKRKFDAGNIELAPEILAFLAGWLVEHTTTTDLEFFHTLRDKGQPPF